MGPDERQDSQGSEGWKAELDSLVRGACGGFLFGVPLLYTMEVWWVGAQAEPPRLLGTLAITFAIVFLLNRTAGFRTIKDVRLADALIDTVEAMAVGSLCTLFALVLLREITAATSLGDALGKIVFEGMPFSLGVALANLLLPPDEKSSSSDGSASSEDTLPSQEEAEDGGKLNATLADLGFTAVGAIFIALNIAPTDEISALAAATSPPWLLALVATSLVVSYGIVFEADFANQQKRTQQRGLFQQPLSETVVTYLVSLAVAAAMLYFFDRIQPGDPWQVWLSHTLLLGLPATIGGAAGRLVL